MLLARRAVGLSPTPSAVAALRQAMDRSAVRRALPTESVTQCRYQPTSLLSYNPTGDRVAEGSCNGQVTVIDPATGHTVLRRHLQTGEDNVAYDPAGHLLAVGVAGGIDLLNSSTGAMSGHLAGRGEATALAFSPDGSMLAATTNFGVTIWDLARSTSRQLIVDPLADYFTLGSLPMVSSSLWEPTWVTPRSLMWPVAR